MISTRNERLFFGFAALLLLIQPFLSDAIYDEGDGILHYQISRWSWKHPELLLHHWGKPVFTLLASPFAQVGYNGVVIFNLLCHLLTVWLTYRIASQLRMPYPLLGAALLLFAPISWGVSQSGLTEPLFALVLTSGIWFVVAGRNGVAALIISLLPFCRTEGFFLAPLFGIFFLLRKDFTSVLLLSFGTILYSAIGALWVHHDLLWVIHQNPYKGAEELYGSGSLFHFAEKNEFIFGWSITLLLLLGLTFYFFAARLSTSVSKTETWLITGSFVVFFILHSVFWWKGLFGSFGLIRVMASVIPCAVLISLRGLSLLLRPFLQNRPAATGVIVLLLSLTLYNTIHQYGLIRKEDLTESTMKQAAAWIMESPYNKERIHYGMPLFTHLLERDPFDTLQSREMWGFLEYKGKKKNEVVIWEPFLAGTQHGVSLKSLRSDTTLQEAAKFGEPQDGQPDHTHPGAVVFVVK